MSVTIVAIQYVEPEYQQTIQCIDNIRRKEDVQLITVDRNGYGSLAEAINRGMAQVQTPIAWILTNVLFHHGCYAQLLNSMQQTSHIAITPAFHSDHKANRFIAGATPIRAVPFIEFTAPMVRTEIFNALKLDEDMPYWGHDLDFGYRAREAGHTVAVNQLAQVQHTYIRFNEQPHPVTEKRKIFRHETNFSTQQALIKKYGNDWKRITGYL